MRKGVRPSALLKVLPSVSLKVFEDKVSQALKAAVIGVAIVGFGEFAYEGF
jgi:hypothetical protein